MASNDSRHNSQASQDALELLNRTSELSRTPYDVATLAVPDPAITSLHDPDMQRAPEAAAFYWPGGQPDSGVRFEVLAWNVLDRYVDAPHAAAALICNRILDARISHEPPKSPPPPETTVRDEPGVPAIYFDEQLCVLRRLPLVVCEFSTVTHSDVIQPGKTAMRLWYPSSTSPEPALGRFKRVVKARPRP